MGVTQSLLFELEPRFVCRLNSLSSEKWSFPCRNIVRIAIVLLPHLIGLRNFAVQVARTAHTQVNVWLQQMSTSCLPPLGIMQQRAVKMRWSVGYMMKRCGRMQLLAKIGL